MAQNGLKTGPPSPAQPPPKTRNQRPPTQAQTLATLILSAKKAKTPPNRSPKIKGKAIGQRPPPGGGWLHRNPPSHNSPRPRQPTSSQPARGVNRGVQPTQSNRDAQLKPLRTPTRPTRSGLRHRRLKPGNPKITGPLPHGQTRKSPKLEPGYPTGTLPRSEQTGDLSPVRSSKCPCDLSL